MGAAQALEEHRIGVGERARVRVEDIGVEEVCRVANQGVRDPRQAPDTEERIVVSRHLRAQVPCLRPRDDDSHREQEHERTQQRVSGHGPQYRSTCFQKSGRQV